jgi:superfamily II DNA or RNA helicase
MKPRILRLYQNKIYEAIKKSYASGSRRILVQLPTGGGKSVIFSKVIKGADGKGNNTLFLVHRRELINQASQHLTHEGVGHGIIMAKVAPDPSNQNQLASIQTLWSRCFTKELIPVPNADVVVIDEGHHVGSKMYDEILKAYDGDLIVAVTATPTRKNGKGLGQYFDDLILARDYGASVRQLMNDGFLAEANYMVPAVPDMTGVRVARGDYVEEQLGEVMNDAKLVGDIVEHWTKYAAARKTIVFSVNVAHSRAIVEMFNASDISAAHVDGKTPLDKREKIINDYENGKYKVLSNCQVFTEGVDMPEVGCVILARPTKSLGLYLQMAGRGLRPKEDGGDCLILDHAGNVLRHGPVDEEHDWNLDERTTIQERDYEKKEDEEPKEKKEFICEGCGTIFSGQSVCPNCGTKLPDFACDVDTARGELISLEGFKPPKKKEDKKKKYTQAEKQHWYSMFLMHAQEKGYAKGWAYHKYKEKFGVGPSNAFHRGLATRTPEFMNYIKYLNIKYAKSRHHHNHKKG